MLLPLLYKAICFYWPFPIQGTTTRSCSLESVSQKAKEGKKQDLKRRQLFAVMKIILLEQEQWQQAAWTATRSSKWSRQLRISDTRRKSLKQVEQSTSPGQENTYKLASKHSTLWGLWFCLFSPLPEKSLLVIDFKYSVAIRTFFFLALLGEDSQKSRFFSHITHTWSQSQVSLPRI